MTKFGLILVVLAGVMVPLANSLIAKALSGGEGVVRPELAGVLAKALTPTFFAGVLVYGLAASLWFYVVATEQLSVAYPVLVAISFILTACSGVFFLGEPMTMKLVAGISLIAIGIYVTIG